MNPRKPSRKAMRRLCGHTGPEDGVDPKELARQYRVARPGGRKTSQLCHQIAETIDEVLAEQPDDVIRDLTVVNVEPAPDESRLLVTVAPNAVALPIDPITVIRHLDEAVGRIRTEVSAAITRRKTPSLEFRYALPGMPV
jgi:ribosome-binding factor A